MKTITQTVYTAQELKDQFPSAFESAHENYKRKQYNFGLAWGDEMLNCLRSAVETAGYRLKNYSLGDTSCRNNYIQLDERDCDELSGSRAIAWLENNLLSKLRNKKGELEPGNLTGYCFDYEIIEALQKAVKEGDTVKDAFKNLADVYAKQCDAEWDDQLSEERFIDEAEANDEMFLQDGRII